MLKSVNGRWVEERRPKARNLTFDQYYDDLEQGWLYGVSGDGRGFAEPGFFGWPGDRADWVVRIVDTDTGVRVIPEAQKISY